MTTLPHDHNLPNRTADSAAQVPATKQSEEDEVAHDAIVLEDPLDGSLAEDERSRTIGFLLIVGGVAVFVSPVMAVVGGAWRLPVDLCCLLVVVLGVCKAWIASRHIKIRSHRAKSATIWKEALRAEYEGNFAEAVRLYGEITMLFPNAPIADDAAWSIELLKHDHKIPLDMGP